MAMSKHCDETGVQKDLCFDFCKTYICFYFLTAHTTDKHKLRHITHNKCQFSVQNWTLIENYGIIDTKKPNYFILHFVDIR